MIKIFLYFTVPALIIVFSSCTTYYIPLDSFKQQFADLDNSFPKKVTVRGPGGGTVKYETFPMDTIKCVDSKGNPIKLKNSPSIEIRFIYADNKQITFYFDLMSVNDSTVTGIRSRIIPSIRKTIPINTIRKIEIQDGHKDLHYVN
jgi:hypothetical protein